VAVPPHPEPDAVPGEAAAPAALVEVVAERLVAGGAALSRRDDGRIVLVDGALPGERALVRLGPPRRGAERGAAVEILDASAGRRPAHCAHVADGCGGCDLALLDHDHQIDAKVEMVVDALRRLGRITDPQVRPGPALRDHDFRTTLRLAVVGGRGGLRALASHDVVALDHCVVAHPLLDELVHDGRFGRASEVTLRVGAATGERLALVHPTAEGVELPDDVIVVGADELAAGRRAWIHDEVVGRSWRISAESFFQTRPDGAAALVDVVAEAAADVLEAPAVGPDRPRTLVDAYCGVGLFSGALLDRIEHLGGPVGAWRAVAVERSRSSVADARHNLRHLPARVVGSSVERFRAPRAELVVADPSRAGLGRKGAEVVASTRAARVVLVSCDPASAGRDAALLEGAGYQFVDAVLVDLFPHTHHVEVVSCFDRVSG
jgi:23S rRNA (uracil1939-C5)-methyltransferase